MALCLPRRRRATSLATLPKTLSVASITNHSCVTSAALALKVFMVLTLDSSLLLDRWSATLRGGALSPDRCSRPANRAAFAEADGEKPSSIAAVRPGDEPWTHGAGTRSLAEVPTLRVNP